MGIFSGPKRQVFLKTISGKNASAEARGDTIIKEFKSLIAEKIDNLPPQYQSLIFGSKPLVDTNTVSCNIGPNITLHMGISYAMQVVIPVQYCQNTDT